MQTEFSIIVPSYNGSDTLPTSLQALGSITRPDVGVEVLLIDNASEDETPTILETHAKENGWRVLSEPRRGKSFALNTALEAASGNFIVFMDDDIIPDPGWLMAYVEASRSTHDADVFAGQLRPQWSGTVPDWLQSMADEGRCCGCTSLQWKAGPYPANQVKGGNLMVRRVAIDEVRFDTVSNNFDGTAQAVGGEDTRFVRQVALDPSKIVFVPDARARHILQEHETLFSALFRRQMRIGRSDARVGAFSLLDKLLTFPAMAAYALAFVGLMVIGKRTHSMKQMFKIAMRLGRVDRWFWHTS